MAPTPENIQLPARLDQSQVKGLADNLLTIDAASHVVLDAADVTHFGSLCVQTIIAGAKRARTAGGSYALHNLDERAQEQLASMGLNQTIITEATE